MVAGATGKEEPTEAERLAGWERQVAQEEMQALSQVHTAARAYAAAHRMHPYIDEHDKALAGQHNQDRQRQRLSPEMLLNDKPADSRGNREHVISQHSTLALRLPQL